MIISVCSERRSNRWTFSCANYPAACMKWLITLLINDASSCSLLCWVRSGFSTRSHQVWHFCRDGWDVSFESSRLQRSARLSHPELQRIIIHRRLSLRLIILFTLSNSLAHAILPFFTSLLSSLSIYSSSAHLLAAHEFLMPLPRSCAVSTEHCCCELKSANFPLALVSVL